MITTEYTIELRMEKSIQRITQPICIRINENETQCIRAKLTYENSPYSVQCDSAELHLLRDDGTWSHLEASVSGSSVTCTIKANQLGKHAQNACAYFFFKQGAQTETTESFQMRVERAAIDTEASDAFFDASMNRIATKWGAYEATAEAQESARKDAESKRITAEQERTSAEQARVQAEQKRAQAEQKRISAESEREQKERNRNRREEVIVDSESKRREAESNRVNAEQQRVQAEQSRVQAETARQSNETTRTSAEQSRQSRFNEMLDAAQNVKFRILSSNEVDSEGKPTITGSSGIIYLVKAQQAQETQANHYNEWIYLENRWELFGSTAPTAAAIEVADIDKLEQGTTIAGNRVLNATGLNALWSKLQARLQSADSTAKQADKTAKEVKNNMDWLVIRQVSNARTLTENNDAIATLKNKMASVESKLNDVAAAKKSFRTLLIQIRGKADNSGSDWLLITFKNEKGMCTVNMWVDNSNVSQHFAPKNNNLISILGGLALFISPFGCVCFDWIISPDYTKTKGSIDCEFINVMLSIPAGISFLRNQNKSFHAQVSYMRDINETNISKLPELLAETNKQLSEQGLIASYELY